jgi:hypothetical protein
MATYQPGQTVTLKVAITTNHLGRHAFRLCPMGATQDSECTNLQRCAPARARRARPAASRQIPRASRVDPGLTPSLSPPFHAGPTARASGGTCP